MDNDIQIDFNDSANNSSLLNISSFDEAIITQINENERLTPLSIDNNIGFRTYTQREQTATSDSINEQQLSDFGSINRIDTKNYNNEVDIQETLDKLDNMYTEIRLKDMQIADLHRKIQETEYEQEIDNVGAMKIDVIENTIIPENINYVKSSLCCVKVWNFFSLSFTASKYILALLLVPCFAFVAPYYPESDYSLVAGILSLVAIAFEKLALFCTVSSKKRTEKMNNILSSLGIDQKIPDTTFTDPTRSSAMQEYSMRGGSPRRISSHDLACKMNNHRYAEDY